MVNVRAVWFLAAASLLAGIASAQQGLIVDPWAGGPSPAQAATVTSARSVRSVAAFPLLPSESLAPASGLDAPAARAPNPLASTPSSGLVLHTPPRWASQLSWTVDPWADRAKSSPRATGHGRWAKPIAEIVDPWVGRASHAAPPNADVRRRATIF